jgi:hypothetical protein
MTVRKLKPHRCVLAGHARWVVPFWWRGPDDGVVIDWMVFGRIGEAWHFCRINRGSSYFRPRAIGEVPA